MDEADATGEHCSSGRREYRLSPLRSTDSISFGRFLLDVMLATGE